MTVLIVEDEHALGAALELATKRAGFRPKLAASGAAALQAISSARPDAVVLDIGLPDISGLEVLEQLRAQSPELPVLIITAHGTLDHAVRAQQLGATDYLTKPLDLRRFDAALRALVAAAPSGVEPLPVQADTMIGGAPAMQEVFLGIAKASAARSPVLISGPSGCGKTLAARLIHLHGGKGKLCSERPSSVEDTWLIENVDQLSKDAQAQLARGLGGGRLIVTLGQDPQQAMEQGHLLPELYYALSALHIVMPSLAARRSDVPALANLFLGLHGGGCVITAPAMAALEAHAWPGNVRELRAAVCYAADQARGGAIYRSHLPAHITQAVLTPTEPVKGPSLEAALGKWLDSKLQPEHPPLYDHLLDHLEAQMLQHLLRHFGQKPTHLAAALRMNRATLRQKLRRLLPEQED